MKTAIKISSKEEVKKGIIALGQELIRRAEDVSNDIEHVASITIYARLNPAEIVNFDITKNYTAYFEEVESEKENEK